jgi:flagellar hook-associated protein 1 FlgK
VYETLASQAGTRRVSVSGVSTDEELVQLMRHQQAYAAAAKLVSAADEMAQTVLNMV